MNRIDFLPLLAILIVLGDCSFAAVNNLGQAGIVYPIDEKDALSEIGERVSLLKEKEDYFKEKARERVKAYRPESLVSLPRAEEPRVFTVDMSFTWNGRDIEIPCSMVAKSDVGVLERRRLTTHGGVSIKALPAIYELKERCMEEWGAQWKDKAVILYPKGFTFNPLDYISSQTAYVFINANDEDQLAWLADSKYRKDLNAMVLITEGGWYETMKRIERPVYYANKRIVERFKITNLPSIARQAEGVMEITEVLLKESDR